MRHRELEDDPRVCFCLESYFLIDLVFEDFFKITFFSFMHLKILKHFIQDFVSIINQIDFLELSNRTFFGEVG